MKATTRLIAILALLPGVYSSLEHTTTVARGSVVANERQEQVVDDSSSSPVASEAFKNDIMATQYSTDTTQQALGEVEVNSVDFESSSSTSSSPFLRPPRSRQAVHMWPFGSHDGDNNVTGGDTCAQQPDCPSCTSHSRWCHWCEKENECHSKGSFYGCFSGTQCAKNHTVDPDDQHGCAAHKTCGDCATASHFCHWCGHDRACHAIGSVYGCAVGVDCYSNDRCKRAEPERIKEHFSMDAMKALPVAFVTALAALICCCATVCFCVASGVKGAYDDLADIATAGAVTQPLLDEHEEHDHHHHDHDLNEHIDAAEEEEHGDQDEDEEPEEANTTAESFVTAVEQGEANADEQREAMDDENDDNEDPAEVAIQDESDPLIASEVLTTPVSNVRRRSIRPRRPRHMQRLHNACTACYLVTLILVGTMVFCSVRYFPKIPVYNICNDNVAWKSIIDGMTHIKTEADFELLASLSNPNHISVALDRGSGSFYHNGKFAGNFTIPAFTAEAMSVTDILIIASLTPGTWDAVTIAREYYNKNLILHVNTDVLIRVPALADFTYEGKMEDLEVHVNELSDRHLCACPSWDQAENHSEWLSSFQNSNDYGDDDNNQLALALPLINEEQK